MKCPFFGRRRKSLRVALNSTVQALHEQIKSEFGMSDFNLHRAGVVLAPERTLASYGIEEESTVEIRIRGRGGAPQVR